MILPEINIRSNEAIQEEEMIKDEENIKQLFLIECFKKTQREDI